ncbi:hypothetical protein [Mycolicibacterium confluentis]|uniref:Uncharacterized protein n=1 Tax=Mycolicibacterium confluentis TaxID=28047 RepID=A0A7I7Y556_9MYCO|nr:hypothetical protein [Mycolicibacterium confluentis]BBZ36051.1 hypothetical protein MCNF_46560 [Mycolicibacterium confluentis]
MTEQTGTVTERPRGGSAVLNWTLALTTILGAAAIEIFAYVQVLGTAGCSDRACPRLGPGEIGYTIIIYGAPIVAVLAILLSFVTARRPKGILVPVVAWILLLAAFVVLVVTFP